MFFHIFNRVALVTKGTLFIVSGFSGVGKTTLVQALLGDVNNPSILSRVVTYTSRMPRPSDIEGLDYHFISQKNFEDKIKEGFFGEWSYHYGHYYGSPRIAMDALQQGRSLILIVDPGSVHKIAQIFPQAITIEIRVSSFTILLERLNKRGAMLNQEVQYRFLQAHEEEAKRASNFLYHFFVLNDSFEKALLEMKSIIFSSI